MADRPLKIAIVHDWLVQPGGAELVLREAFQLFPSATLFALIDHMPEAERTALDAFNQQPPRAAGEGCQLEKKFPAATGLFVHKP